MSHPPLDILILGLSITSSWGNGHATTYRGLVRELEKRGHRVLFLERDVPWYASHRDLPNPPYGETHLYATLDELKDRFQESVRSADLVIVGSYVPEGVEIGEWAIQSASGLVAFYDIDTPVTLEKIKNHDYEYLKPELISKYDLYLSFTGGPILKRLESEYGSPLACPLYCSVDPELYFPEDRVVRFDLGYMGTYSDDRQTPLEWLMFEPARKWNEGRFIVAGPQYPSSIQWPENVQRIEHLPPEQHKEFYNEQRYTLNITRSDMIRAGYSPSIRLFEAAACATPIISDYWDGLNDFFEIDREILVSRSPEDTINYLTRIHDDERLQIGLKARQKVLSRHTASHRAAELEEYAYQAMDAKSSRSRMFHYRNPNTLETWIENPQTPLEKEIATLGPWFHNLRINGHQTAPEHPLGDFPTFKWSKISSHIPNDLTKWRVLDIGCNAGFYSFEMAKRGAEVLAIDIDEHYLQQARWAAKKYNLMDRIRFRQMQVYEIAHLDEVFDLVIFMGVFYHLRYPLLALDILAPRVKRLMIFQTLSTNDDEVIENDDLWFHQRDEMLKPGWPKMAFIEHRFAGDPTNWWVPNHACVEALLRSSGFTIQQRIEKETYLCIPQKAYQLGIEEINRKELMAAARGFKTPISE